MVMNYFIDRILETGSTRADFQSNGILSLTIEIWKRWARPGANSSATSFSGLPGMLSDPVALCWVDVLQ